MKVLLRVWRFLVFIHNNIMHKLSKDRTHIDVTITHRTDTTSSLECSDENTNSNGDSDIKQ